MMNWVCCSRTLFVLFFVYTSLDHCVVESSPIPDNPQNEADPNTGLALDTEKNHANGVENNDNVNIDTLKNKDDQDFKIDQQNEEKYDNIDEHGESKGKYAEHQEHDAEKADDDSVLNEDVKEGIVPGRQDIGGNEQDVESQDDEVGGDVEHFDNEDTESIKMSELSAQKEDLLPVDLKEGHAADPARSQIRVDDNNYQPHNTNVQIVDVNAVEDQQNVNAVQDQQNVNVVQDQQIQHAVQDLQNVNAIQGPQNVSVEQDTQNVNVIQDTQEVNAVQDPLNVNAVQDSQNRPNPDMMNRYPSQDVKPNSYDINETLRKLGIMAQKPDQTVINPAPTQIISDQGLLDKPQITQPLRSVDTGINPSESPAEADNNLGGQKDQPLVTVGKQSYIPGSQQLQRDYNPSPYSKDSQNVVSNDQQKSLSRQAEDDVPEEFNADAKSEENAQPDNHYSDDGYLDPPANNLDNDRNAQDKTDEDVNRINNNYDDSSDPNANLNNKNIIDDNNEEVLYNNGYHEDDKKDEDESYENTLYDDKDDEYSYEEKIDRIDGDESTTLRPSDKDHWYHADNDDIVEGKEGDVNDTDFVDTVIDEEVDFQRTHVKQPQTYDDDNSLYFSNRDPTIQEGVVEYKLIKNRNSLNAPSSMVLFYTWIILIVLIAVVTLSAFRYRCKGIMNGQRNYRNGNHGNYRNGEENKKLLENVYT